MAGSKKNLRLLKIAKELNVGIETLVEHLQQNNIEVEARPNAKVSAESYELLLKKFSSDKLVKEESKKILRLHKKDKEEEAIDIATDKQPVEEETVSETKEEIVEKKKVEETKTELKKEEPTTLKIKGKIDLDNLNKKVTPAKKEEKKQQKDVKEEQVKEVVKEEKQVTVETESTKEVKEKQEKVKPVKKEEPELKIKGKIDLDNLNQKTKPDKKTPKERKEERQKRRDAKIEADKRSKQEKIEREENAKKNLKPKD